MPRRKENGKRPPLKPGEKSFVQMVSYAADKLGADDPLVRELISLELRIACGDRTILGRHVGERSRVIRDLLDRLVGKPNQPVDIGAKQSLADLIVESFNAGKRRG